MIKQAGQEFVEEQIKPLRLSANEVQSTLSSASHL
jgi:hypothetical protein